MNQFITAHNILDASRFDAARRENAHTRARGVTSCRVHEVHSHIRRARVHKIAHELLMRLRRGSERRRVAKIAIPRRHP
ncbi:MAG: hypothetical protein M0R66_03100 [Candidatus Omnitrophica bacterium]|nr:hypothetical protein [Candidatus Omnitrophota bacterium]